LVAEGGVFVGTWTVGNTVNISNVH